MCETKLSLPIFAIQMNLSKWNIDYKWSMESFGHTKPLKKFVPNMSSYIFQTLCTT